MKETKGLYRIIMEDDKRFPYEPKLIKEVFDALAKHLSDQKPNW